MQSYEMNLTPIDHQTVHLKVEQFFMASYRLLGFLNVDVGLYSCILSQLHLIYVYQPHCEY